MESVKLNICNKNLLDNINKYKYDEASSTLNGGTVTLNSNGSVMIDATKATKSMGVKSKFYTNIIPMLLPAGTYYTTVSLNTRKISDKTLIQYNEGKFTINEPTYIQQWYYSCDVGKSITVLPQIEVGEKPTEPEQHLKTQINIDLKGNKLCAISDTIKDKLLIDKNGNVALQKNVLKGIIVGNVTSTLYLTNNNSYVIFQKSVEFPNFKVKSHLISNMLIQPSVIGSGWSLKGENIDVGTSSYNKVQVKLAVTRLESADLAGLNKYLNDNNITFYYETFKPQLIDLGQLTELPKTFNGINNIWAETNLGNTEIEIEYVQDVKKLLEQTQAIILNNASEEVTEE